MRVTVTDCDCDCYCYCECVYVCVSVCVCAEWGGGEGVTFRLHFTTRLNMRGVARQESESARYRGRKRKRNSNSRSNSRSLSQGLFFYSPKKSYLSIVGPLGLSGSLSLGLLVFELYQPTFRDLYSPRERITAIYNP